ncbi:unnamed protein product [Lasius platythorax]|uniref:Uncharacterized protein n=1 Tax=Lasius platythorax TaxID=488582 RepID=A0AAV2NFE8_9HYME
MLNERLLIDYSKMPVHHSLLWISEIQGEEFHGPIDGVRPIDYPETYGYLMELRCVMALENQLYQNIIDLRKIYNSCYAITSNEPKCVYQIVSPHNLVHKNSADNQIDCTFCNNI